MSDADDRFAVCAATVMTARGAFSPHDPLLEGPCAHGIGLGLLSVWIGGPADAALLRGLDREAAARILRAMVWAPLGAARLPRGPDLALFAFAIEAGTLRALMDMQAELGVEASGAPDAPTLSAASARNPATLALRIAAAHAAWREARGLPAPVRPAAPPRRAPARLAAMAAC